MAKNKGRPENLIPLTVNDERAREIRSKGGKARVQKLHERKKMREDLGNLLKITLRRWRHNAEGTNFEQIELVVINSNERAKALYKKFGFREVALRKFYYGDEDGILMEKQVM